MKLGLSIYKGADITEDILHDSGRFPAVLTDTVTMMGIGAHSNNLSAQFFEAAQVFRPRQILAASVQTAGIELHTNTLVHQDLHDLIGHFPIIFI